MGEQEERYYDVYEVAELLGVSVPTVWNLIRRHGVIRYKLPGERRTMLRAADVERIRRPVPREDREEAEGKAAA